MTQNSTYYYMSILFSRKHSFLSKEAKMRNLGIWGKSEFTGLLKEVLQGFLIIFITFYER